MVAKESQNFGPLLADQAYTTVAQRENVSLLEMSKRESRSQIRDKEKIEIAIYLSQLWKHYFIHIKLQIYTPCCEGTEKYLI